MFLKKLELNGFKSFCDPSEITFVRGTSAIVGPNGCGKSNIIDALKWVIGEQRVKMLRGNSMTDVIFKGTEERKGLSRAEVRLTIVNEDGILPIDYNEVEIARVIFVDGENEYYINKKRVRLKDIQELFFDTGVGKSAYSVMEQGKIDLILSNKPEDRRYMVEEAAGITKYKVKREESMSRLVQAEENIIRIKDIIEEVKTQFDHMQKQAEKALEYKKLHEKEITLEIELNLNRVIKQKDINANLHHDLEKATKECEEVKLLLANLEDGIEDQLEYLTELENKKIENQREVFKLQSDIKILGSKSDIFKEQIKQYEIGINTENDKIGQFENRIKEINEELTYIENSKKEFDEKILSIMNDVEVYTENITTLDKEINQSDNLIVQLKNSIAESNKTLEDKRIEQKVITDQLIVKIDQSLNIIDVSAEEIMKFKSNLKEKISEVLSNLPNKRAFLEDIIKGGYISKDSNELLKALNSLRDEIITVEEKIKLIDHDMHKYIETTEVFLNDIFGPEGSMQQKRKIENKINELIDKINKDTNDIEFQQHEILKKRAKKDELNKTLHELNINLTTLKEKKNSVDNDVKRLMSMRAHHQSSKEELTQKVNFYKEKMLEVNKDINETNRLLEELNKSKDNIEKELLNIDKKIKDENTKMSTQQKNIKAINEKWMNKKSDLERINIKIAEAETTISNIYQSFYENFSIDLEVHEAKKDHISTRSYDEVRKDLSEIKASKHMLGNVNLMAIEECKTLEERYNLLSEQLADLEKAKKDILEMMEKINQTSEELFIKTFQEINQNFKKIFTKLFDGGNAEISLTKPDNILESGLEIVAHPPGQKTQTITLLSGGQRTMTAIALMFATFLVKPSPFCLLDEIDAALDEENVRRFISLLHEFKDKSQFVMITHNNKTISAADVMYGVTQELKGISKIVSAKFAEKAN